MLKIIPFCIDRVINGVKDTDGFRHQFNLTKLRDNVELPDNEKILLVGDWSSGVSTDAFNLNQMDLIKLKRASTVCSVCPIMCIH